MIKKLLAAGKLSNVFVARPRQGADSKRVALKNVGGSKHFAKIHGLGQHLYFQYLAMDLLGPTIYDIVKRPQMQKLSLSSVVKIGIQCLEILSVLHSAGFAHGRICLENFAIGFNKETQRNLYLIDFSESKKIDNKNEYQTQENIQDGQLKDNALKYQQTNKCIQLVQNDLQDLLRMLMALFRGVGEDQIKLSDIIENTLIEYAQIQSEIIQLNIEISKIDFESIGDYEEMIFVLRMMAESNRANLNLPFEWEVEIDQLTKKEIKNAKNKQQQI
ncbi:MAG: hypothetical protein EZS28_009093 [Streblomastix strix]|uniref:Protein kinase domain-containing protein n=1 Tax=Streblomastix strix TaxID=222440 RepID=A0A5J4WLE7_9EUKA|nr:MAG: hypothetical protein EZS28_009093 [Streblomastix strix]